MKKREKRIIGTELQLGKVGKIIIPLVEKFKILDVGEDSLGFEISEEEATGYVWIRIGIVPFLATEKEINLEKYVNDRLQEFKSDTSMQDVSLVKKGTHTYCYALAGTTMIKTDCYYHWFFAKGYLHGIFVDILGGLNKVQEEKLLADWRVAEEDYNFK